MNAHPKTDKIHGAPIWQGIACIILAIVVYKFTANMAGDAIQDCIKNTQRSYGFCRENGVSWPIVYIIYAVAALFGGAGVINFFLPRE